MKNKVLFRFWTITDYEKEEQFLAERHKEGWEIKRYILPGFYIFEKCTPREMVYRLDFGQAEKGEKAEYLQMYRDYGWEYLFDVNSFSYFRKPADSAMRDTEIFSDNKSRLEMVQRIFMKRMVPLMIVFLFCVLPQLMLQTANGITRGDSGAKVLAGILAALFVLYVCLLIHCGIGIWRLRRKYGNL